MRTWFERASEQVFAFNRPETRGERLQFRCFVWFVLGSAVYFAWQWGVAIEGMRAGVVHIGLAQYLDLSFLYTPGAALVNAGLITLLALVSFASPTARWNSATVPLLLVLLHLQYVARHALGKTAHGSHYVGMALLMLALAAWLMPTTTSRRRFALSGTAFCMGIGYVFAGLSKLSNTGPSWPSGQHLWMWIGEKSIDELAVDGAILLNPLQELSMSSWGLATAFLAMGLLTELFGFLLWFQRTRFAVTVALIGLHAGIALTLGIVFGHYMVQLALVGLPLSLLFDRLFPEQAVPHPSVKR